MMQSLLGFVWPAPINAMMDTKSLNCIPKGKNFSMLTEHSAFGPQFSNISIILAEIFAVIVETESLGASIAS